MRFLFFKTDSFIKMHRVGAFFAFLFLFAFGIVSSASAFSIEPARQTAVLDPGATQIFPLTVTNDGDASQIFTPELSAFSIDSKTGSPIFGEASEASGWFRVLPERLLLQPGQSGTFSFSVSVPSGAESKSHYLGLFARAAGTGGQIGVSSRLGSLLFLHISGEIREELIRKTFRADTRITRDDHAVVRLVLENVGTIHVVPDGIITIKDRSDNEIAVLPLNPEGRKILPGGIFEAEYPVSGLTAEQIGPLRASLDMRYGAAQKELHDSTTFWYIPNTLYLLGVVVVAFIIFFVLFFFFKKKKRTRTSTNTSKR